MNLASVEAQHSTVQEIQLHTWKFKDKFHVFSCSKAAFLLRAFRLFPNAEAVCKLWTKLQ